MATLVLTAVGSAFGGPLGGAVGATIGNRIDHATIFRPATREGPRLAELAVQTSSYGNEIPRLYGTMRVAGTVIWSTDLMETRTKTSAGKGQPSTATYSYAASFAVLLSGRPIVGIGRIWADGRLVRGSAGDLKVKALLRVHGGAEDQPADPLIASAEDGVTPAYRGMAYLVFEQLPLADFGNRIPSLTVEVMADADAVPIATIARDVAVEAVAGPAATLAGFAVAGSVRGVLGVLEQAADGWWAARGRGLALCGTDAEVRAVADGGVRASGAKARADGRSTIAIERIARVVALSHYDPARDFQAGLQRASRPGAGAIVRRTEMPAVLEAGAAKTMATRLLGREEADRTRRTLTIGLEGIDLLPGALVRPAGETGVWRVLAVAIEAWAVRLTLAPLASRMAAMTAASGRVAGAPDERVGATLLRLVETPALGDDLPVAPRLTVVAAGEGAGWRQATLLWSADDGASWTEAGLTAAPGVLGAVEQAPAGAPATLVDDAGTIVVRLATAAMQLHDADDAALDRGGNLASVGGELIQFGRAMPLGDRRWRLSRLWRGRRGTAAVVDTDGFVLLTEEAVRTIDLPVVAIGRTVRVMASGVGDDVPAEARIDLMGAAIRPPAPVHLRVGREADGIVLRWVRRSRAGWRWTDGIEAPLVEETERYRVTLATAGKMLEVDVAGPWLPLPAGFEAPGVHATVRQRGTWGESAAATIIIGGNLA